MHVYQSELYFFFLGGGGEMFVPPAAPASLARWGVRGTSFAAPSFAGIQALVNQQTGMKGGNPNPVLYNLAATEYGTTADPNDAQLAACNANNGAAIGGGGVFNKLTR